MTPTLIVVALVVVGFIFFANVWTDVLWYQQLGFFEVFLTENLARISIFAAGFAVMFAGVFYAIRIAYHARPVYAPDSEIRDNLNRYQAQLEPVRRVVMVGLAGPVRALRRKRRLQPVAEGAAVLQPGALRPE